MESDDPTAPGRDVFNEKPALEDLMAVEGGCSQLACMHVAHGCTRTAMGARTWVVQGAECSGPARVCRWVRQGRLTPHELDWDRA